MKPINLQSTFVKEVLKYLGWVLLFAVLWFKGCNRSEIPNSSVTVNIPEVKGKFEAKKPKHTSIVMAKKRPEKEEKTHFDVSATTEKARIEMAKENEKLKQDFAKEKDSLKRIIAYNKSVQLNKFSTTFDDDNLLLNIDGIVQGEIKEITPSYTIKEKKVEVQVKPKATVFRLLGGLELGNNTKLDGFAAKANLMLQNKKGNIISGSFDTNQNIWIGYNFSIFDVKR